VAPAPGLPGFLRAAARGEGAWARERSPGGAREEGAAARSPPLHRARLRQAPRGYNLGWALAPTAPRTPRRASRTPHPRGRACSSGSSGGIWAGTTPTSPPCLTRTRKVRGPGLPPLPPLPPAQPPSGVGRASLPSAILCRALLRFARRQERGPGNSPIAQNRGLRGRRQARGFHRGNSHIACSLRDRTVPGAGLGRSIPGQAWSPRLHLGGAGDSRLRRRARLLLRLRCGKRGRLQSSRLGRGPGRADRTVCACACVCTRAHRPFGLAHGQVTCCPLQVAQDSLRKLSWLNSVALRRASCPSLAAEWWRLSSFTHTPGLGVFAAQVALQNPTSSAVCPSVTYSTSLKHCL
jgi:hypothetical protein